jgi:predicted aspartyl protease
MKLRCYTLLLYSLLQLHLYALHAQSQVIFPPNETQIEIPFEMHGNFMVLPVVFQRIFPLRFIYDTGAENSILLKKEISDLLGVVYEREITVYGSDMSIALGAQIARKVFLDLPNIKMIKDMLILNEDFFRFDENAGVEIHGILGSETFKGHVVKINYARQIMTIYAKNSFKPPLKSEYDSVPIKMIRNKPYVEVDLTLQNDSIVPVKLLLDTGASLSMLLYSGTAKGLTIPANALKGSIGRGLGGNLEGHIGRVKKMQLGSFPLTNVISRFQTLPIDVDTTQTVGRNGIIGAEIMARFNLIFDYTHQIMYLQPNNQYKNEFIYDRSGLTLVAGGRNLSEFTVQGVLPNTPAARADIRVGDKLVKIGIWNTKLLHLTQLTRKFQGKVGKEMNLTILRDGQKLKKKFKLQELI